MQQSILDIRSALIKIYKKNEVLMSFLIRFFVGLIVFTLINQVAYTSETFSFVIGPLQTILCALFFAILPNVFMQIFVISVLAMHLTAFPYISILVFMFGLMAIFLFTKHFEHAGTILILSLIAYYLNMPFVIPIIIGLYFGLENIITMTIAIFILNLIPILNTLLTNQTTDNLIIMSSASELINYVMTNLSASWVAVSIIFAIVAILVRYISRTQINYAKEIAMVVGFAISAGFISIINLMEGRADAITLVLCIVFSAIMLFIVRLFDGILDYKNAINIDFEDENYYYQVKVIPKFDD